MPIYNLFEDSSNYSDTTNSLCFCSKDEATTFDANIADNSSLKSFEYKTKLIESNAAAIGILENTTIAVPLKYLRNF